MVRMRMLPILFALCSLGASPSPSANVSNNYYYSGNWYYSLPAGGQKQQESNPHQPTTEALPRPMAAPLDKEAQAASSHPTHSQRSRAVTWFWIRARFSEVNWSNWALVAVAIWAGRAAWGSWQEMKAQTQANTVAAEQTLKLTQEVARAATDNAKATADEIEFLLKTERPYLFVSGITFTTGEFLWQLPTTPPVATLRGTPVMHINVQNAGRTPAIDVVIATDVLVIDTLPQNRPDIPPADPASPDRVIAPLNNEMFQIKCPFFLTGEQMTAIGERHQHFTIYGVLKYRGVAASYETGFAAVWSSETGRFERPKLSAYNYQT